MVRPAVENVKNDDESISFSESDKESKPKPGRTKCAIALKQWHL